MGFDVCRVEKIVSVDHSHNNFAVTTVEGNPKKKTYKGLPVIGIFKRNKGAHKLIKKANPPGTKIEGDNCPMLYALKNMDGLTTTTSDARKLFRNSRIILNNEISSLGINFDHIVSVPSSHKLASIVAKMSLRICRRQGYSTTHLGNVLKKASAADVKAQLKVKQLKSADRNKINLQINHFIKLYGEDHDFQIKCIYNKLRQHVNTLALCPGHLIDESNISILLADDMVTSGSSLTTARDMLLARFPNATIYAVSLFSES